jgi:hypothetical protein
MGLPDCIRVDVTDNVQVAKVLILISDGQGNTLEQGEAMWVSNRRWEYKNSTIGNILVEALDWAGNSARREISTEALD